MGLSIDIQDQIDWRDDSVRHFKTKQLAKKYRSKIVESKVKPISIEYLCLGNSSIFEAGVFLDLLLAGVPTLSKSYNYDEWLFQQYSEPTDIAIFWLPQISISQGETLIDPIRIERVIETIKVRLDSGVSVYVMMPEPGSYSSSSEGEIERSRRLLSHSLSEIKEESAGLSLISYETWVPEQDLKSWYDPRIWEISKVPGNLELISRISKTVGGVLLNDLGYGVKAIALDLDGTIWDGILGDVGVEGIYLDHNGRGRSHLALQRFIYQQYRSGIYLGVISKNNESITREAFEMKKEMILKPEMISYWGVNWKEKSHNINEMAKHLNIHTDSIVFLDDSKFEIFEVSQKYPKLKSILINHSNPNLMISLYQSRVFLKTREVLKPKSLLSKPTSENFMDNNGYQLNVNAKEIISADLDRTVALINKTNQFNLTARRSSRLEVLKIAKDNSNFARNFEVMENGIPMGILSSILVEKMENNCIITEWVLSCRAFSRGIEWYILLELATWAQSKGIDVVFAILNKNSRTIYMEEFFSELRLMNLWNQNQGLEISKILTSDKVKERAFLYVKND